MHKLENRVDDLEDGKARLVFVHVFPGQTNAQALAAHKREHGPIPEGKEVILIGHSFWSRI